MPDTPLLRRVPVYPDWRLVCTCRRQDTTIPWAGHELTCDIGYGLVDPTDPDVMKANGVREG